MSNHLMNSNNSLPNSRVELKHSNRIVRPLISRGQETLCRISSFGPIILTFFASPSTLLCLCAGQQQRYHSTSRSSFQSQSATAFPKLFLPSRSVPSLHEIIVHEGKRPCEAHVTSAIYNPLLNGVLVFVHGLVPSTAYLCRERGKRVYRTRLRRAEGWDRLGSGKICVDVLLSFFQLSSSVRNPSLVTPQPKLTDLQSSPHEHEAFYSTSHITRLLDPYPRQLLHH